MRHSSWRVCAAVILIFLWGALCSPSCPSSCQCQGGSLINCSSVGPTLLPLHFPVSVTILDLSRNGLSSLPFRPYRTPLPHLTHLHLGHNQLTHLSLCEAPPREAGLCETWAPTLELLSAERNQLQHIPEGVCGSTFLHVLSLSHNRISILRDQDLQGCAHLRELHLQHNLITALTPLAFRQMHKLRILDLSFNTLSTFPMLAYLSLRSLNTQVEVSSNPWKCDCRLQALRRWMGVARDGPPWQVVCEEPPGVAGRDLLHLDNTDLTCNTPEEGVGLHQEVTVHLGAEILLPCWVSDQDLSRAFWWTPDGSVRQASAEHGGGLLIPGVRERDQGLYMCVSGATQEPAVMFTVHVRGGAEPALRGGDRTRADLTLAVCLSVFLTFIAAFALGVLTRPFLDILWGKICAWRRPPATPTATPYDNQGFSEREGPEEERAGEGGRVGGGEAGTPYYITILPEPDGSPDARLDGKERDSREEQGRSRAIYENISPTGDPAPQPVPMPGQPTPRREGPSPWRGGAHQGSTCGDQSDSSSEENPAHPRHTVEFEPIPDPQGLGIEEHSTSGSEPDCDLEPDRVHLSDPFPISRDEFTAGWSSSTPPPGEDPFPAPDWTDSPWEPHPSAAQAPPPDSFPPELDAELWNDSGESFEFPDSLHDEVTRGGSSLAQQLKEGPWSPFYQSAPEEQGSHDPTLQWGKVREGEGEGSSMSPSGWDPEYRALNPEITGLSPENTALSPGITALNPENTALSPEITALSPENTALSPEITALSPEITALNPENTALNPEITALNPKITALNHEITALNPEITALNHKITELNPEITALNPEITALNPEITALNPEITALNPEITALNPKITALNPEYREIGELKDAPFQKDVPQPRLTGDAPWVIHVAGDADADTDLTRFESPGAWPPVTHDTEGRGHSPEVADPEPRSSLGLAQDSAGHDGRFGETDPLPPLHPTPADPPCPMKPRRSFSRGTTEQEEAQGAWPVEEVGPVSMPSQGSQRQDWRRGGLFFQKKRAMDTFAPTSQAPPLPGSAHLLYDSVTAETVTMAADNTKSTSEWLPLGEEEMSVGGGEEGSVTSDSTSYFLFGSRPDKGSEA